MKQEIDIQSILSCQLSMPQQAYAKQRHSEAFLDIIRSLFQPKNLYFLIKGTYRGVAYKTKLYRHHIVVELSSPANKRLFLSYEELSKHHETKTKKQQFLSKLFAHISQEVRFERAKTYVENRRRLL